MKKIQLIIFIGLALNFMHCGGSEDDPDLDPQIDPKQEVIDGLSKTWQMKKVVFDGTDVSDDWVGFTLRFDKSKNYTAKELSVESILVWPVSGSYTIPNTNNPKNILRNDGVQIVLSNITQSSVTLRFSISGRSGGKVSSLIGDYTFDMEN